MCLRNTDMSDRIKRILFIANGHAVHTQEWLRLLTGTAWDVHASVGGAVPPCWIDATFHTLDTKAPNPAGNRVRPFWPWSRGVARICRFRFGDGVQAESARLAMMIRRLRPAIVHSLRLQDEGYTTLGAIDAIREVGAAWIVSLWGSDLVWFGDQPEHHERIRAVMAACDYVTADCRRDLELSRRFGAAEHKLYFKHPIPGNGGLDIEAIRRLANEVGPERRRIILFPHARDDMFHRFAPVLEAVRAVETALSGFRLVFLGADDASRRALASLPAGLQSRCDIHSHVSHESVFDWLARSRVIVKPSLSDGTPNVMLEAMALETLPILSPIESIREWIDDGVNGLLASNDDVAALGKAMARAVADDALVTDAAERNRRIVTVRADRKRARDEVLSMYETIGAGPGRRTNGIIPEAELCVSS